MFVCSLRWLLSSHGRGSPWASPALPVPRHNRSHHRVLGTARTLHGSPDGHCAHRRANQPLAAGLHLKISFLIYLERHPHRRDRRDHGSTRPTWTSLPERLTTKYGSARPRPRRDAGADPRTAGGLVELSRLCSRVQLVTPAGAPRSCGRCYPNGSPPSTDLHGHDLGGTRAAPPERLVA